MENGIEKMRLIERERGRPERDRKKEMDREEGQTGRERARERGGRETERDRDRDRPTDTPTDGENKTGSLKVINRTLTLDQVLMPYNDFSLELTISNIHLYFQ